MNRCAWISSLCPNAIRVIITGLHGFVQNNLADGNLPATNTDRSTDAVVVRNEYFANPIANRWILDIAGRVSRNNSPTTVCHG